LKPLEVVEVGPVHCRGPVREQVAASAAIAPTYRHHETLIKKLKKMPLSLDRSKKGRESAAEPQVA